MVKRLAKKGGDPVVRLQTAFGGGKTHAMMAVYHLARGEKPASKLPGIPSILDNAKVSELPRANVAVLDGNALSASQPRKHGALKINTLWGEMAWQLGKEDGFKMLEHADRDGTSPGKEIIAELFRKFSPCVVLLDETVAYVRQLEFGKSYAGGTFESNLSFLQALTEAAGHVPCATVLASLPASDTQAGGERGLKALTAIEQIFGRLEAIWKPVATEEGFEIVRRRLFSPVTDTKGRDAVCQAFADMYVDAKHYPSETREASYLERLKKAYPIHPEVFDRMYEDWSTLENFQRTRGVLRLMAMVAHRLWSDGNQDLMILPGSLPMYDTQVRNELIRYLPQGWEPVVERDVDGPRAATTRIDEQNPMLGAVQAGRRVARTIYLGSAPSASGQKVRGVNVERIRLGCCQPEQHVGRFDDALKRLKDQLHYLYSGNESYWYDTQTNLRREAEDRMSRFDRDQHLIPEIGARLKALLKGKPFTAIHVFTPSGDIPDDTGIRLVVLPPTANHKWHVEDSLAVRAAAAIQKNRGQQPRHNQNRLVYLAADSDSTATLYDQAKRFLAWQSIMDEKESLNLDQHRLKEASKNQKDSDARLTGAVLETFKWLLTPIQEADKKGGVSPVRWEEQRVSTVEEDRVKAIEKVLRDNEMLIEQWSPFHLRNVLLTWFWKDDRREYSLLTLWNDFCRYPYLPRLLDSAVLKATLEEGVASKDFFGYAAGKEGDRYAGLLFGRPGSVYLDESSLILHPDIAAAQLTKEATLEPQPTPGKGGKSVGGLEINDKDKTGKQGSNGTDPGPTKKVVLKRFHGSKGLDPVKAGLEFSSIAEEVLQHFSSKLGTDVKITVEIEATNPTGFDETMRRTVKENTKVLGFDHAEFEEE